MSSANTLLSDLVVVDAGFKPAVHLPDDFDKDEQNAQLIRTYIPTSQSINFLAEVARSLNPASNERARMLIGTFGTGKSDLLLMLCNYFSRPVDDPIMQPFYEKLQRINEAQYTTIYQQREHRSPFLVVLLQADAVTPFPGFILHGLEQALKRFGLEDLMLPTRYAAASQKIEEWQRESHPVLQSFIAALRDNEAKELSTLLKDLGGPGADLVFPSFLRAFRTATGTPFDIYTYNRPEQTYKRVAQALHERGSHSGILVVCDEFTQVLRRLARAGDQQGAEVDSEALGVQDLANTSISSLQNQLHFVVSSLEPFASSAAESTSATGNKVIEKFGGRFKSFELELQDSAELIRGAIRRLDQTIAVLPNRQRDELVDLARTLWRQQGKQLLTEMVVEGCFPLHPLVTYALPLINRSVAQTNRTMFLFLKDQDGLGGFLSQHQLASSYPNWSNLVTLDWLFDYFAKSIQVRRSDIIDAYNHSLQLLARANIDTALARQALKVVALCEVIAPNLSPTRLLLRQALNLPPSSDAELVAALSLLEQVEAIYPPSDAEGEALGAYSLPMVDRVNPMHLRQRVIRKARESQTSVGRLQTAYPPESVKAANYNQRRGSWRELKARYVSMVELNSAARIKEDLAETHDGLLWYVVASSESERSEAQSRARDLTRQHPRLVVAVPIEPLTVLDALKNYDALEAIRSDQTLDGSSKTYLQDTGLVGKGFYSVLTSAVVKLREEKQWEWFREGASQPNILNRSHAQDLASKVMLMVYSNTPEHQLSQQFKAEGTTPSLSRAMAEVLKGEVRISKSGNKPEEVVLRTALTGLGLLRSLRIEGPHEIFSLVEPNGGYHNSQKIWLLYLSYLSDKKPWSKLIETLRKEPYGLYDSLLVAFTAAFLTFYADGIEIVAVDGHPIVLEEKILKALIESPQKYNVNLQPLSEPEKQWLRGVVTVGLRKPFNSSGGQGKTLRSRIAAQVKSWLAGLRLPLFVEKLDVGFVSILIPDNAEPVVATATLLLQGTRTDEGIASMLLNEIPLALKMPDHSDWTSERVTEMLATWAETCQLLEQLPKALERYVTCSIAAVFGCKEEAPIESYWGSIYHWRMNRRIVQDQLEDLSGYARDVFRMSNRPASTIRESFLEEFPRKVTEISTIYHMWPSLDYLDRLVKVLQKSRVEIDMRWQALANEEDVWRDGLASAVLGRPMPGVSADNAARYLYEWATGVTWPSCAPTLQSAELQHFYPDLDLQVYTDIIAVLSRTQHRAEDWQRELGEALPKQFGVEGWTKAEVTRAVARLGTALKHAANLDALLRKHTLSQLLALFATESAGTTAPGAILRQWRDAHPIPPENDLDANARILLAQIDSSSDAETTLLIALPRALPQIAQSYQQWAAYADLSRYVEVVASAVSAIDSYTPLTDAEWRWLKGIVTEVLRRPLDSQSREKHQLSQVVGVQLAHWLRELSLPGFAAKLTSADLRDLFPDASSAHLSAMGVLLRASDQLRMAPAQVLLIDLPSTLGGGEGGEGLSDLTAEVLLRELGEVCRYVRNLSETITRRLFAEIGSIFGVEASGNGAGTLVSKLRVWRQSYVLFANEALSSDAALVSEALAAPTDDPAKLLLTTLPGRLREVRTPYGSWRSWGQRATYLQSLSAAVTEIAQRGHVSDATPHVQTLWENLKSQIAGLSLDEQRWLIKAFGEEFRS
ncbi:MAG: hypothetical protein WCI67_02630 [Chloroflexales bacterium]